MITILIRTLIIYIILILVMRLMGKRQIGELEVTDLVTTLLISEIASLPITNQDIPISYAIIPMITLLILEIGTSLILIRFPKLKNLVSSRPTVVIKNGILNQKALLDIRISLDELMSEIRQQGLNSIEEVECAILEKNGNMTILPKPDYIQPTASQLGLQLKSEGLMHIVYSNGSYSKIGLALIGKNQSWLERQLKRRKLDVKELFCVTANENGKLFWIPKENEKK